MKPHVEKRLQAIKDENKASSTKVDVKHNIGDGWIVSVLSDGNITLQKDGHEHLMRAHIVTALKGVLAS